MVYSYPALYGFSDVEALETRSAPACTTVTTWDDVTQYLQNITYENLHEHVPLIKEKGL